MSEMDNYIQDIMDLVNGQMVISKPNEEKIREHLQKWTVHKPFNLKYIGIIVGILSLDVFEERF